MIDANNSTLSGRCSLHAANTAARPGPTNAIVVAASARITPSSEVYIKSAPSTTSGRRIASGNRSTSSARPHRSVVVAIATLAGIRPPLSALFARAFIRVSGTTRFKSVIAHTIPASPSALPRAAATSSVASPVPAPSSSVVGPRASSRAFFVNRRHVLSRPTYFPSSTLASHTVNPVAGTASSSSAASSSSRVVVPVVPVVPVALTNASLDAYCRTTTPSTSHASTNFSRKLRRFRRHVDAIARRGAA
mmetsp:Transcript_2694/g.10373  ORF Transcript_2694/g.10373 Transcript_2694/m.10373 type:complete len:249 (+) Transcript_2694:1918-2664(+)